MASSRITPVTLKTANTSQLVLSQSDRRVAVRFISYVAGRYTLGNDPVTAIDKGPTIASNSPYHLLLTLGKHGDCVQREWYAMPSANSELVSIIETFR